VIDEKVQIKPLEMFLITGNTRIGGAQRILIDEYYELTRRGFKPQIISLTPRLVNDDILNVDGNFQPSNEISIQYIEGGKWKQVLILASEFRLIRGRVNIVSHDFTGVLICRVAGILSFRRIKLALYIHQLMELSDPLQRQKRITLSLLASRIFVSSLQFQKSWENYLKRSKFWRYLFQKSIFFDRMGVYLPRVQNSEGVKDQICGTNVRHVIFMSRMTAWKGFREFRKFCRENSSPNLHSLILTTKNQNRELFDENVDIDENNHVIYESGVSNLTFPHGSVHLYPTNYGDGILYPQSIGMNVLELLAVGVPSVISPEGFLSWPELEYSILIKTFDWQNTGTLEEVVSDLSLMSRDAVKSEVERLLPVISISSHVDCIIEYLLI